MRSFRALHVSRTHVIRLEAPPEVVFPLFTPLGEKKWAAGWDPEILHPATGETQEGTVFTTRDPEEPNETLWSIIAYEPASFRIAYLRVTPASRLGRIDIRCEGGAAGSTTASVTYTFTALCEAGDRFIEAFTGDHYREYIASWETAMNHYLKHGECLESG